MKSSKAQVVKSKDLNIKDITMSKIIKGKTGGKTVYLNYKNGSLNIQMPKMMIRGNIYEMKDGNGKVTNTNYNVNLSFFGEDENHKVKEVHKLMKDLDQLVQDAYDDKFREWTGKKKKPAKVYKPCVRENYNEKTDTTYADDMRIKVRTDFNDKSTFECNIFNAEKNSDGIYEPIEFNVDNFSDVISRNMPGTCVIQCAGVWVNDTSYGLGWRLLQAKIKPPTINRKEYDQLPDTDE